MQRMEEAPGLPPINDIDSSFHTIDMSYRIATDYLKTSVCSYVWIKCKNFDDWRVSTWSKKVTYNVIMKNGTESDIDNLPEETRFNRKRKRGADDNEE